MATRTGLEPVTSAVTGRHSNQLNYRANSNNFQQLRLRVKQLSTTALARQTTFNNCACALYYMHRGVFAPAALEATDPELRQSFASNTDAVHEMVGEEGIEPPTFAL